MRFWTKVTFSRLLNSITYLTLVLNLMWVNPRAPTLMRLRRGWSWWSNARHRWGRSSRPGWGSFLTTCPSTRSPSPHPAGGPRGGQGVHHGLIDEGQDCLGDLKKRVKVVKSNHKIYSNIHCHISAFVFYSCDQKKKLNSTWK